jgi:hypothetical protein
VATSHPSPDVPVAPSEGRPLTRTAYQLVAMASISFRSVDPPGLPEHNYRPGQPRRHHLYRVSSPVRHLCVTTTEVRA